ncbi:MAG: 30S ribosomal protein S12 methylthiotransferase RimO [Deltaproteobacteria bacterium]|nr:30S ribosomal protein S12 methylthiotransferase RimO [Deltaproteobacteria bacterium]
MSASQTKKVCLVSLGCSKNLVDSEVMLGILKESGAEITPEAADADVIIVNTCGFINDAKEESIDAILALAKNKKAGRCSRLVVTGCLSQRYKDELAKEMPEVDCFVGTGEYHRIAEVIKDGFTRRVLVGLPTYIHDYDTPRLLSTPSYYAYVKVAEGCSNHCSYCSIPAIRGEMRSRSVESVVREAASLAGQGVKEINLIAQDTTSYGFERGGELIRLLRALVRVDGIEWIRLLYLYPGKITDELISVMKGEEKIVSYIDLPLQHISERVLKAMNRRYARRDIEAVIEKLRKEVGGVTLRTSLIAGFPGETDKEFKELLSFIEDARFDRLGVFTYSREEGTPAFNLEKQVSAKVKAERMDILMQAQRAISLEKNEMLIGRRIKTLIEGGEAEAGGDGYVPPLQAREGRLKGRASSQAPDVDGAVCITKGMALPGTMAEVLVTGAEDYDIIGEIT